LVEEYSVFVNECAADAKSGAAKKNQELTVKSQEVTSLTGILLHSGIFLLSKKNSFR
jgi:hypothetical protein